MIYRIKCLLKNIIYFFKPLKEYPAESNISWVSFIYPVNSPTWTTDKNIIYIG